MQAFNQECKFSDNRALRVLELRICLLCTEIKIHRIKVKIHSLRKRGLSELQNARTPPSVKRILYGQIRTSEGVKSPLRKVVPD